VPPCRYQPLYKVEVALPANNSAVALQGKFDIKKAGLHYLMYSSCDPEAPTSCDPPRTAADSRSVSQAGDVYINGHNAWMNPYGYLSGELYYNIPFFLGLLLMNVLAIVVWGLLLAKHWEEVLPVQAPHTGPEG